MEKAKLTISIVVYKSYADILLLLDDIEKYVSKDLNKQIYIVDNSAFPEGNPDRDDFCRRLSKYADVKYIDAGGNIGFGAGHNLILTQTDSKYHAIVNPDIRLKDDAFSKIISYMDENPDVGMTIPRLTDDKGNLQSVYRRELTVIDMFLRMFIKKGFKKRKAYHTMQDMDYTKPFNVPFGQGSFLVIRTDLLKKLNGFDERFFLYMEDADLCKRVNQISQLMYYPGAEAIHNWERGSYKNKKLFITHVKSMIKYFGKWGIFHPNK